MTDLIKKSITNLRILGVEQIHNSKTRHPGMVMSAAPLMHTVYLNHLNIDVTDPLWVNRDRFVLSAGHGSALLYAQLVMAGFDIPMKELKNFRQINSLTPGHPEFGVTPGVDVSTGPLGQGIGMGVGLAAAEKHLSQKYNQGDLKIIDHYTYVICGDADLEEGVAHEAMQLAGVWKLNKLIVLYDSNDIQLDSAVTSVQFNKFKQVFEGYDWNYLKVEDGNDVKAIDAAIKKAKQQDKPTIIECKTLIGEGHKKSGTPAMHGEPWNDEAMKDVYSYYNWSYEKFTVLDEVKQLWKKNSIDRGSKNKISWNKIKDEYKNKFPQFYQELFEKHTIKQEQFKDLLHEKSEPTRASGGEVLKKMHQLVPNLFGGSADLIAATKVQGYFGDFSSSNPQGNNILFGVREFGMGAIINGIALHSNLKPFGATFLVFSDYMKNAIRLSALQKVAPIYVLTHDSIAAGYDGPTHQPIEQLVGLRATPNLTVLRPADLKETIGAYTYAYNSTSTPTAIILCRQNVGPYQETCWTKTLNGAYVVGGEDSSQPLDGIIIATVSELAYALYAKSKITNKNLRVVSMPSVELFNQQPQEYQEQIIPKNFENIITIEASSELGWHKFAGKKGLVISADKFGDSGFGDDVLAKQGFENEQILKNIKTYLNK
ncbi:transketolase [Spiroplasma clarkii]|uniref:Transketolase n=1 Tax=Spiroplasma clarkii TaxID=2139 RepID=A0A1Y0L1P5_9MOLU|nr:transketolase [Spiroplasma clarkii]ARU91700.1 transketolase [Spiroplasma clarkii]ATX71090.1 transketolase [Spiroplasma clarkii]